MKQHLLTTEQAARYLGGEQPLKTNTLEGWRVKGIGPAYVKLNRLVRYSQDALDSYITTQTRSSTTQVAQIK